jgi:alpha-tubulin suppressor-like RCC1 family protein
MRTFLRRTTRGTALASLTALAALGALAACDRSPTDAPDGDAGVRVAVVASVAAAPVDRLVAEVTGPDIAMSAFNIPLADGTASGTILVPAGSERTITLKAFDRGGTLTHRGARTLAVREGTNPSVSIVLEALTGELPLTATLGSVVLTITGAIPSLVVGDTLRLVVSAVDAQGGGLPGRPRWSVSAPGKASIDSVNGFFVARDTGTVRVTATHGGASASVQIAIGRGDESGWASISTGNDFSCGVRLDGAGYCWGQNFFGELGNGGTSASLTPVAVAGGHRFQSIQTAYRGACGLTTDGRALCWGNNRYGRAGLPVTATADVCMQAFEYLELGVRKFRTDTLPCTRVPVEVATGVRFTSVHPGVQASCGRTAAGEAYCWGVKWEIGAGNAPDTLSGPPTLVPGYTFAKLSRGAHHTCGLTADGRAICWGGNWEGQLGDGGTLHRSSPVAVATSLRFKDISAGPSPVTCGVATQGDVHCWGDASLGILGAGIPDTTGRTLPVRVESDVAFERVYVGSENACAESANGSLYCWGSSGFGQLGDGNPPLPEACMIPWDPAFTRPCATRPSRVPTLFVRAGSVSAGGAATCAFDRLATPLCWGGNWFGKLGDGTTFNRHVPTRVQHAP